MVKISIPKQDSTYQQDKSTKAVEDQLDIAKQQIDASNAQLKAIGQCAQGKHSLTQVGNAVKCTRCSIPPFDIPLDWIKGSEMAAAESANSFFKKMDSALMTFAINGTTPYRETINNCVKSVAAVTESEGESAEEFWGEVLPGLARDYKTSLAFKVFINPTARQALKSEGAITAVPRKAMIDASEAVDTARKGGYTLSLKK